MKQGKGKLLRVDGSVYHGTWEANTVVGLGSVTFPVGDKSKNDGLPKQVRDSMGFLFDLHLISCSDYHEGLRLLNVFLCALEDNVEKLSGDVFDSKCQSAFVLLWM
jgi:hypothetical protein